MTRAREFVPLTSKFRGWPDDPLGRFVTERLQGLLLRATLEPAAHFGFRLDPVLHLIPGCEAALLRLEVGRLLDQPVDLFGRELRRGVAARLAVSRPQGRRVRRGLRRALGLQWLLLTRDFGFLGFCHVRPSSIRRLSEASKLV